ncbi:MAG: dethiobiotin synthase [Saprospiraceae bacterium]|nr:dethiobiotin synthase [Saprospiraceae bacterium]
MNKSIFVTGIGTEVGKTVISAILVEALQADYWKPIQAGDLDNSDAMKIQRWISNSRTRIHPEAYRLHTPMSPHTAAEIDGIRIELPNIKLPNSQNFIIVEGAGGLFVPLNNKDDIIDLIQYLQMPVILVSKHYLGSINHTLLSIEALLHRNIPVAGLIFNGDENPSSESIIQQRSGVPILGRVGDLGEMNKDKVREWAERLKPAVEKLLLN